MGLSNGVVIILCILGAGFVVICGAAVTKFYFVQKEETFNSYDNDQASYMREVRMRNRADNQFESRYGASGANQPLKGAPSTYTATTSGY